MCSGNLWSSLKEVKPPVLFDREHPTNSGDLGLISRCGGKSHGFLVVTVGTWGFLSSYDGDVL